jgi:hypothetical protein
VTALLQTHKSMRHPGPACTAISLIIQGGRLASWLYLLHTPRQMLSLLYPRQMCGHHEIASQLPKAAACHHRQPRAA